MRLTSLFGVIVILALVSAPRAGAQCTPDPGSQIANGSFNGPSCWTLNDPQQLATVYYDGNFYAQILGGVAYDAVQLKQLIPVSQGAVYQVSFFTWGTPDSALITFGLQRDNAPYEQYGFWQDVVLGSTSVRYTYRFTCSETDPAARFTVFLGNVNGEVWLDEIRIENVSCQQNTMLVNPTFDCNPDYPVGWQYLSNDPSTTFGTDTDTYHGTYALSFANLPGTAFYDAFIEQQFLSWTANRFSLIRFWAKGSGNGTMLLKMQNDATGATPVWIEYTPGSDWTAHALVFRPTESTDTAHLTLYTGSYAGDLLLDAFQYVEVPMPDFNSGGRYLNGDFDGDGKQDVVYAEMRDRWQLWVARSTGENLLPFEFWGDWFGPLTGKLVVGNWNGVDADSLYRDDVAIVAQNAPVFVRLSDGTQFYDPGTNPWAATVTAEVGDISSGDCDASGTDDIVVFTKGSAADVYVMLSTGSLFVEASLWHSNFAPTTQIPYTGDFNRDGKSDIITFRRGNGGEVYVALSTGTSFGQTAQWAGLFCLHDEWPAVGDLDNDGDTDIVTFVRLANDRRVWAKKCTGSGFGSSTVWHGYFGGPGELHAIADLTGDGMTDAMSMEPTYRFYAAQSWGNNFGDALTWYTIDNIPYVPPPDEPTTGVDEWSGGSVRPALLLGAFPNPLRDATTLTYSLATSGWVTVRVFDASGRLVTTLIDRHREAGERQLTWNASSLRSGVYFARLDSGGGTALRKLLLVR